MSAETTKLCRSCSQELSVELFSKNRRNRDGYRYSCKACEKKKAAEYYGRNKGRIGDKVAKWQGDNSDKVRGYKREYYRRGQEVDNEAANEDGAV
jgi:hypothetical protein